MTRYDITENARYDNRRRKRIKMVYKSDWKKGFISVSETAKRLRVSERSVLRWVKEKKIGAIKGRWSWHIKEKEVVTYGKQ